MRYCAELYGVEVILILDLIHVLEYLWRAAFAFHPEGSVEAEQWVSERLLEVLGGKAKHVAANLRRTATRLSLSDKKRKAVDKCAKYLSHYAEMLRYDEYLAAGLPIASGVIEGACRHLVKDRMERTGARWSLQGAEAVLRLRAVYVNGDFEEYWRFHLRSEWERNHARLHGAVLLQGPRNASQAPTNHLHTVIWEESDLKTAGNRLALTIRTTLPDEAKLDD